jgi:hypothetical protein
MCVNPEAVRTALKENNIPFDEKPIPHAVFMSFSPKDRNVKSGLQAWKKR